MSSSWLRLTHKCAIVTGAGSGLGAAVAKALAGQGCRVVLADANGPAAERVANEIVEISDSGHAEPVLCDVTDPKQVEQLIVSADLLAAASTVSHDDENAPPNAMASILVNCAGITRDSLLPNMTVEDFDSVIDVNLKGTWLTCKYFCAEDRLAGFRASQAGASIINIGSVVSKTGNVGQTNYGASKGGVVGLTRSLAKEMALRHNNVRANAILPGFIDTAMAQAVPQKIRDAIQQKIPLGSFGRPEDVANLTLFLASSERSGYITGECIECSGMIAL